METTNTLAWTQVAEIELIYKSKVKASERPKVTTSSDAYHLLKENWDENKIEFVELSTGGVSGTVADSQISICSCFKGKCMQHHSLP